MRVILTRTRPRRGRRPALYAIAVKEASAAFRDAAPLGIVAGLGAREGPPLLCRHDLLQPQAMRLVRKVVGLGATFLGEELAIPDGGRGRRSIR